MTLQERIAALPEISLQTIREHFTFNDFKFEILSIINDAEPNLDNMSTLFLEVDELMQDQPVYNIFSERVALKTLYLHVVFGVDLNLLNSMLMIEPLVALDMDLNEEIFKDDHLFHYIESAFKEYKINNGLTLATIMKYMSTIDLAPLAKQLESSVGDLQKLAKHD